MYALGAALMRFARQYLAKYWVFGLSLAVVASRCAAALEYFDKTVVVLQWEKYV